MASASSVFLSGLSLALGLLVAIGPQNAFILRQGIAHRHVGAVVCVCILCDVVLISLGVGGIGNLLAQAPEFLRLSALAGAVFLALYGGKAFYAAWRPGTLNAEGRVIQSRSGAISAAFTFTLLNPYVYLDTVIQPFQGEPTSHCA